MMMRSISWLRPSTLLRKRGADDLDIGMGIRMVLGIGDCKTHTQFIKILFTDVAVSRKLQPQTGKKLIYASFFYITAQHTQEKIQLHLNISIHKS